MAASITREEPGALAFSAALCSAGCGPPNSGSWKRSISSMTLRTSARLCSSLYWVW